MTYYKVNFHPKPDITAYELALICKQTTPHKPDIIAFKGEWDDVPEEIKRHFTALLVEGKP